MALEFCVVCPFLGGKLLKFRKFQCFYVLRGVNGLILRELRGWS